MIRTNMLVNVLWITTDHTTNPAWITIPGQTPGLKSICHLHGMDDQLSIPLEDEVIGRRHTKAAFSLTIDAEQLRLRLPQLGDGGMNGKATETKRTEL